MSENPGIWERLSSLQPALVRAIIVGIVGVIVVVTGKQIDDGTVDMVVNIIMILLPIVAGLFIKRAVTPNAKVVVLQPDPVNAPEVLAPGAAVADSELAPEIIHAATTMPRAA